MLILRDLQEFLATLSGDLFLYRRIFSTDKLFYVKKGGQRKIYQQSPKGICCFRDASSIHREKTCTRFRTHMLAHTPKKKQGTRLTVEKDRAPAEGRKAGGVLGNQIVWKGRRVWKQSPTSEDSTLRSANAPSDRYASVGRSLLPLTRSL